MLGYPDEKIKNLSEMFLKRGFKAFKMKVGSDLQDDKRRLKVLRDCIGWDHLVMVDANQKWSVPEAIQWMKELAEFKLHWYAQRGKTKIHFSGNYQALKSLNFWIFG